MGKRYESKRGEVRNVREESDRIKNDQETLNNEFSLLSAVDSLLSEIDDEAMDAIANVEKVGEQESSRLETEHEENNTEKNRIADEIDSELEKLRSGLGSLKTADDNPFGKNSLEHAKNTYIEQMDAFKSLLDDLGEESNAEASSSRLNNSSSIEYFNANEYAESNSELNESLIDIGVPINTKEGYSAYLRALNFVENADFGNLDVNTAKDMTVAIQETKSMFPELDLKFVGSLQSRNEKISQGLSDFYYEAYKQYNPNVPDEKIREAVQEQVSIDLKGFEPGEGTIAQSLFVGNINDYSDSIISELNGITINESYGSDYSHFTDVRKSDVDSGWKPQNCYSPKATVDHELGHQIAKLVDAHNDKTINDMYQSFSELNDQDRSSVLSGYAGTNIHEFIAESWSEYRNNPQCRECARTVAERMIELYEKSQPHKVRTLRR